MAALCLGACSLTAMAASKKPVTVALQDGKGAEVGTVKFTEKGKEVQMEVALHNLPAGQHAIHVHANGVCTAPDFVSAGGHLNPDNKHHGFSNPEGHHVGDFPASVTVEDNGIGTAKLLNKDISLKTDAPTAIFGKSVVVHELADDQKTDPAGASGKRLACGVIPAM
jgi:Cu-Zn family superoxide dismutase